MQQVEKKKRATRPRGRLWWLLAAAVLLALAWGGAALLKQKEQNEPDEPAHIKRSGSLAQRAPEDLLSLSVTRRGGESWTVVQDEDGTLHLEDETGWTVDESLGERMRDAAVNPVYEDILTEDAEDWKEAEADFGLTDPRVTAVITYRDGETLTLKIGNGAELDEQTVYYMTTGEDDRLYVVPGGLFDDLNAERAMLHPVRQPEILQALLDRITVYDADGTVRAEWQLQGSIESRTAQENWLVTVPFVYPADYDTMKNLRENAENLRLGIFEGEATEGRKQAVGLDGQGARIELHMVAGSTGTVSDEGVYDVQEHPETTVTLYLGGKKSDLADYVGFEDEVFSVNHFTLSVFTDTDPLSTASRYPVLMPLSSLDSLTVEKDGQTDEYCLIREQAGEGEDAETTIRVIKNGEEISYDAFSAAYDRLLVVTVSGKLPDGAEVGDMHTIYTFRTLDGGTHTVALSDFDAMHDAVTVDGHTLFYLIKNGMTPLP